MSDNPYASPSEFDFQSSGSHFPPPHKDEATTVLVYGILGMVICGLGIVAWLKANEYQRRCRLAHVEPESSAVWGRILGIISTVVLGVLAGCILVLLVLALVNG